MSPRARARLRPAVALALVIVGLLTPFPAARAASGCEGAPCVVVDVVGTTTATAVFSLADLDRLHDVTGTSYDLRSSARSGETQSTYLSTATSLRALVAAIPDPGHPGSTLDPDAVTYTEVLDTDGQSHPLRRGDLAANGQSSFEHGLMPAVYAIDQHTIGYVRPLRGPDDVNVSADPNLGGYFLGATDGELRVVVHTSGALLAPQIEADATRLHADAPDGFRVSLPARPDGQLSYAWDFGDGTTSTAAAPTHSWTHAGTFPVAVTVTAGDGSSGRSESVTISVDAVASTSPSSPGGTGADSHSVAPVTGPTKGGGHHRGGTGDTRTPVPAASAGPTVGTGSAGSTSTGDLLSPSAVASEHSDASATATPTPTPTASAQPTLGVPVSGIVLMAAGAPVGSAADRPEAHAARSAAHGRLSLPRWLLPMVIVLVAFLAGGLRESRPAGTGGSSLGGSARGRPLRRTGRMRP